MFKKIVKKFIGEYTLSSIKRVICKIRSGKETIITKYPLRVISEGKHTSCGYYDHTPVCSNKLLYISTDSNMKTVFNHCLDFETCCQTYTVSNIANWQQGNRLFWIEKDRYIYNDFEKGAYVSKEINRGETMTHPWPVYDANGQIAVSLDFSRLGSLRPGYGYSELPPTDITENAIAMSIYRLDSEAKICDITYRNLLDALKEKVILSRCYINHISISPKGDRVLFFFIEKKETFHMCYLGIWDSGKIRFLERELSASHYTWKDNDTILTTSYDAQRNCGYYLYHVSACTRKDVLRDVLIEDGHPTYISEKLFLTDTYPDSAGYQRIKLVNLETGEVETLLEIYSSAKHMGVKRCDLHPRYDSEHEKIYFDANTDGWRRLYLLNLEGHRWIRESRKKDS